MCDCEPMGPCVRVCLCLCMHACALASVFLCASLFKFVRLSVYACVCMLPRARACAYICVHIWRVRWAASSLLSSFFGSSSAGTEAYALFRHSLCIRLALVHSLGSCALLSDCLSGCLCICLLVSPSVFPSDCLLVLPSVYVYLSVCPCVF